MNQVELFLFDCKHMDPDEHKRLTGLDNVIILQNLHALFEAKKALHIRVPLMPGINDTEKNIAQMAAFLHNHGHNEVDVLPCHTFGHSKYAALNLPIRSWFPTSRRNSPLRWSVLPNTTLRSL